MLSSVLFFANDIYSLERIVRLYIAIKHMRTLIFFICIH